MYTNKVFIVLSVFFLFGCSQMKSKEGHKKKIKDTDIAFSDYSEKHGLNAAFIKYADSSAVLLKPGMKPIKGIDAIKLYHEKVEDAAIVLTWYPSFSNVSESADLGYSYGLWTLMNKNDSILGRGTYLTIWKKQEDGSWKYVLDTGNSGLGE